MKIVTTIIPVGNGFGVEIPQKFLESFRIVEGDVITLDFKKTVVLSSNFRMREDEEDDIDHIITEHPKSERDMICQVEKIVEVLCGCSSNGHLAPLEDIISAAEKGKIRIDKGTTLKILNELKIKGILYEPKPDRWKWVG